ncbi:protein kinase [Streptomyces sp. NPDC050448]|uniref:protein kinase domain-containing protein n=1 Tax=Streptomyces sp. NPDC050448 TaxID=3155404 RepID=UPI0034221FEB
MQPLETGEPRTIGAYRLLGRLGSGGMGRVYLGRSAGGRTVAVKIVHPHFASDEEFRARFRREVEAARRVGGEWTAPVLDADPEAPVPWVATGYVAGPSLGGAVAAHGPLPEASVRAVGEGLARALVAVHGLGLVHRDVKPSNVMLSLDGPRLIDFGIARATDGTASLTSTGVSIGSPGYMSPEQILGKGITGAADVFSLGAVLAFAATGRPPFSGDNSATLLYKVVHEPPDLDAVPAGGLRELIAACLAKAAADRPVPAAIAQALAGALHAPGWLPAPLVEEASRAAVALLDLEAAPAGPSRDAAEASSGPAPFTNPSYGGGPAGGFGPAGSGSVAADTPYPPTGSPAGGSYGPYGPYGSAAGRHAGAGFPTPGSDTFGAARAQTPYGPYGAPPAAVHGSPTETAGAGVPQPRTAPDQARQVAFSASGRRFSCSLVLATAAVLAVLSGGGLYGMGLLPGLGGDQDRPSGAAATPPKSSAAPPAATPNGTPTPTATDGSAPPQGNRGDVPKEFTGTWKGTLITARAGVSSEFEITIKGGKVGEVVARDKSILPLFGTDCSGDWKLASATDRSLVLNSAGGPNPAPGICSNGSANERFTLNANGTLHYKSGDGPAGNPEGDLTRIP